MGPRAALAPRGRRTRTRVGDHSKGNRESTQVARIRMPPHEIQVVDSHTGGEPTRVVVSGGPDLGTGSMAERRDLFRAQFDRYRRATICEPRGSDVIVGALLCPPVDPACVAGAIFFNNVGYLGMCGH